MKRLTLAVCLLAVIGGSAMARTRTNRNLNATVAGQEKKSLYDRLGGYNAVAAVVDDFIGRKSQLPAGGIDEQGQFSTSVLENALRRSITQRCGFGHQRAHLRNQGTIASKRDVDMPA